MEAAVADRVARRLADGYDSLTPPEAVMISMTKPPGVDDLGDRLVTDATLPKRPSDGSHATAQSSARRAA